MEKVKIIEGVRCYKCFNCKSYHSSSNITRRKVSGTNRRYCTFCISGSLALLAQKDLERKYTPRAFKEYKQHYFRFKLWRLQEKKFGNRCPYSGGILIDAHLDHVVPHKNFKGKKRYETLFLGNAIFVSKKVNLSKGSKSLKEFLIDGGSEDEIRRGIDVLVFLFDTYEGSLSRSEFNKSILRGKFERL